MEINKLKFYRSFLAAMTIYFHMVSLSLVFEEKHKRGKTKATISVIPY